MDEERYSSASLSELIHEQELVIRSKLADLIVARHSLDKARTQYLVLENYHPGTQQEYIDESSASLHALSEYVRQLEDQITTAKSLIRAYKRAKIDNLPWRRAFRWTRRFVMRTRMPRPEPEEEQP